MHPVEAEILLVMANQGKHDVHFVVIVGITWGFHNLRYETVQSEVVHERLPQFVVGPRNRVLVLAIHLIEPNGGFGAMHLQQVFGIVLVSVRLNPLDGDFLHGATPIEVFLFENAQGILKRLVLRHHGKPDAINHAPHAVIQILTVQRVEKIAHGIRNARLRRARYALLVIVGTLEPHLIQNRRVVYSHNKYLLSACVRACNQGFQGHWRRLRLWHPPHRPHGRSRRFRPSATRNPRTCHRYRRYAR